MNRKLLCVFVFLLSFSSWCSAQMIDSMMNVYAEKYPQEKVYLQFDKKAYNPGDRIWYKAYLFAGLDPSLISKNFYTELYDAGGNLILRNVAPITASTAKGSFDLPGSFEGTRIRIRAYTAWMLNFDTSFVFTKDLRIIGTRQDSVAHPEPTPTVLHFFPEGGDLIAGVENNIAFKAEDGYGQPRKISGVLKDQTGKVLLNFNAIHNGMGKFILIPDKQDVFTAFWNDEKGIEQRTDLPAVKPSGVVLRVSGGNQKLVFSIARPPDALGEQQFIVIAQINQQIIYKANVNLKDVLMSGGNIPTQSLPTGIVQVTVFDTHQNPLAERVCFVNTHDYAFNTNLNLTATSLKKRGRNELVVELPASINSDVSIAITDAEVDGNQKWDDNIISSLLLTGDLHGYIKNPFYYFQNGSDSLAQQLDLVMLTHGWRRFRWEDLAKGKTPVIKFPVEDYLSINAEVLGVDNSRIAHEESLNVFLQRKDSATSLFMVPYQRNGKFRLSGLSFYDTAKAYYQFSANPNLSREAAVIFKNGLYPGSKKLRPFNNMTLPTWWPDDSSLVRKSRQVFDEIVRLQNEDRKVQSLEAVTVKVRVKSNKEKLDEMYSRGLFAGGNATIFDLVNDPFATGALNIFTYLQGKVAGLQITTGPNPTMSWRGGTPTLYIDEMRTDPDAVSNIPVNDVAMIKVFAPGESGVISGSSGGVISIYTKRGQDRKPDPSIKGLEMARIPGYSPVRQFYTPDYLINPEPETNDIRTTLYWNPNLHGGKGNSKITIPFYNSDVTHRIRIILEGFDETGKLTHAEKNIE